ncbi:MAG: glycolate oxidase subunit GlcE [Thiobacillus sp.]|nr:glycolate oxidase subunit GlcE [Thiobacillus sp.]
MLNDFIDRIQAAHAHATPLVIRGGGSKAFYGNPCAGDSLDVTAWAGVVEYQPKELVLTARAGTPLAELEMLLAQHGQMLAFEPPHFGGCPFPLAEAATHAAPNPIHATLGGCVAAGLSGPRRPYAGAVRDSVLGVRMIDGTGQALRFGGQVIKNVAGYDVSRLMTGSLGTLGLLTEVSLKVLPKPTAETTLQFESSEADAILKMNQWAGQPLSLSATSWHAGLLTVRLSGAASAVHAAQAKLGGETLAHADEFWLRLRDHAAAFFDKRPSSPQLSLWRLAVKPSTLPLQLGDTQWIEWGGAVRWLISDLPAAALFAAAKSCGGHATLFCGKPLADGNLAPLSPALLTLHRNLKQRFDPQGIFNHGRLYPDF